MNDINQFFCRLPKWNIKELTGYEPKTTFWEDFSIADAFGIDAIKDTYKRAFNEWKTNTEYITEFVMVLNHKCFYWYNKNNEYSKLYSNLYYEADQWCLDNLKGDSLRYYIDTTD